MNFVADESVDQHIVDQLRFAGHHVINIAELSPGTSDEEVLRHANEESAILLTADKDFGEIVFRHGRVHGGVVLIRLFGLSSKEKVEILAAVLRERSAELSDSFTVVSPGLVRIRHKL